MGWGKLDDSFCDHPKVVEAGNEAAGALSRMISYSAKHRTDGWVPTDTVRSICMRPGLIRRMILHRFLDVFSLKNGSKFLEKDLGLASKMWRKTTVHLRVHDYLDYNPSREEDEENRAIKANAGRKGAEKRWGKSDGTSHDTCITDPDPDPDPIDERESAGEKEVNLKAIEEQCSDRCGFLVGPAVATMRKLEPIYQHEVDAALTTHGQSYGYLAKVIVSYRREASGTAPPGSPKRPAKRLTYDEKMRRASAELDEEGLDEDLSEGGF